MHACIEKKKSDFYTTHELILFLKRVPTRIKEDNKNKDCVDTVKKSCSLTIGVDINDN